MLQLRLAPARKVLGAAIRGKPSGIPKSNWRLHTELVLESSQRGSSVVGPVTPGAASQAVLHKHKCLPSTKIRLHAYVYIYICIHIIYGIHTCMCVCVYLTKRLRPTCTKHMRIVP